MTALDERESQVLLQRSSHVAQTTQTDTTMFKLLARVNIRAENKSLQNEPEKIWSEKVNIKDGDPQADQWGHQM